ncbi:AraC family transcriptional regulator [Mucilaginibacter pedocola]|uniref:AraC family transcriptional regulator n=2 Tax=Mucilaginibacter pedocola TaxID=1792845 RepID=A0A1S9PHM7_9SPHI|nr:AraC family transcriptional regulator [Mucilaginibacter pedocola]OOQ58390.1 AraC family transcriptional regulator [Mucilaginibacter pedocola]OOQ58396.1 AraC family transcriptional regulator [Mucilaginibacter pedocola]OOQ60435.1 AraC family transcriptional regulator [Mucilaginibacter pedocola]
MKRLGLAPPAHPLISLVNYDKDTISLRDAGNWFLLDFYKITFKRDFNGSVKYGPGTYDFKEGGMAFLAPGQSVQMPGDREDYQGYALYFHPSLLTGQPLAQHIYQYGFFDYTVAESLYLSDKEKQTVEMVFQAIASELENQIDQFSDKVLVSLLELLFDHSDRFYHRQFHTRKNLHHELITRMNDCLESHFDGSCATVNGLPSPQDIAAHLNVSQRYLSDMLRSLTGKTTQQHIHLALIEKAKILLNSTGLTTAEIAYQLGFEHPQSFHKLFKQRTHITPVQFRRDMLNKN